MTMQIIVLAIVFMARAPQPVACAGAESQLTQAPMCAEVDKASCEEKNNLQNNEEGSLLQVKAKVPATITHKNFKHKDEASPAFTVLNPDPSIFTWDKPPVLGEVSWGKLSVHLDPFDIDSPKLSLQVKMVLNKQQPAPHGVLFFHQGGPASDAEVSTNPELYSGLFGYPDFQMGYDMFTISQRGYGKQAQPSFNCIDKTKLPPVKDGLVDSTSYKISDFTDCECAMPDGAAEMGDFQWANIDATDANEVLQFFQAMSEWGLKCYSANKFQLKGKKGKSYNFLDYVGTANLAHDLDQLRIAFGQKKLNLFGTSYGTQVCGTYATIFPENVNKLVLDGNVNPFPQKTGFAEGGAWALEKNIDELLLNCKRSQLNGAAAPKPCSVKDPYKLYADVTALAKAGKLTATAKSLSKPFVLSTGMLYAWLLDNLEGDQEAWTALFQGLEDLASGQDKRVSKVVAEILDARCKVRKTPTWSTYGICVGTGQTAELTPDMETFAFVGQSAILGSDLAGRYLIPEAMKAWKAASHTYTAAGLSVYTAVVAAIWLWPGVPTPIAPIGNTITPALVVGNLYDPATNYAWSQHMSSQFPAGAMMSYQGVGHGIKPDSGISHCLGKDQGSAACDRWRCFLKVKTYLVDGVLPEDGYVCRKTVPVPTE